jgi:hypothetical protein
MNIVEKRLNELKPYENNPRINDGAVKFVKNSIEEFGFKVPIVIDKNGVIVAGHTRYKASQELGLETVPCVVADDLTDEQVKAFRIADNKTAEKASWDLDALNKNWDYSRGNFSGALQIAKKHGRVHWKDIEKDMYFLDFERNKAVGFNTNTSEARAKYAGMTMKDYLHYLWNSPKAGQSPYKIFEKVLKPVGFDENNDIIYEYDNSVTFLKRTEEITELEAEEARHV